MYDSTGNLDYTDQEDVKGFTDYALNAGMLPEILEACCTWMVDQVNRQPDYHKASRLCRLSDALEAAHTLANEIEAQYLNPEL